MAVTRAPKIAPSVLSLNPLRIVEGIRAAELYGADMLHVDIIDGVFAPNISFGPAMVKAISDETNLPLDIHMMVANPLRYVDTFASNGADYISVHVETLDSTSFRCFVNMGKTAGFKAGVAMKPHTLLPSWLEQIIDKVDFVVPMSVEPGFSGQKFISESKAKILGLSRIRQEKQLDYEIEADGGVNQKNVGELLKKGVNIFVAGSAVFGSQNVEHALRELRAAMTEK